MVNSRFGGAMRTARGAAITNGTTIGDKNYRTGPLGTQNIGTGSYQIINMFTDGVSVVADASNFTSAAAAFGANLATATSDSYLFVLTGRSRGVYSITTRVDANTLTVSPSPVVAETSLYHASGGQDVLFDELRQVRGGQLQAIAGVDYGMFVCAVGSMAKFKIIVGAAGVNTQAAANADLSASSLEAVAQGY